MQREETRGDASRSRTEPKGREAILSERDWDDLVMLVDLECPSPFVGGAPPCRFF